MRKLIPLLEEEEGYILASLTKYMSYLQQCNSFESINLCKEIIEKIENAEGIGLIQHER